MKAKTIYYCHQCKKIVHTIREIFFVEQTRYRGFCSEECITHFFSPLIDFLRKEEQEIRKELDIKEDLPFSNKDFEKIIELALKNPTEVWVGGEELSEEMCYIIYNFTPQELSTSKLDSEILPAGENFYCVVVTLLFENTPSFILTEIVTRDEQLIDYYRKGKTLENAFQHGMTSSLDEHQMVMNSSGGNDENADLLGMDSALGHGESGAAGGELSPEMMSIIDEKRSGLIAELLKDRTKEDIPMEMFPQYEIFLSETLERPDEIYRYLDQYKDSIFTYVRAYSQDGKSFYYIVICIQYQGDMDMDEGNGLVIPILSFPSVDVDLYRKYKKGEKIGGPPIN
ncbi:MAG: hypothetical protein HQK52_16675 [Oligoflexia bacterium]|nr:hypothetical protein [Oligoflexia bacterium]